MKVLVIGGTIFLGRHLVAAARGRGHDVTIFTRGQHNPDLFPDIERLRGDRDGNLDVLRGRRWDVVIDTCGNAPRLVRDSAMLLADAVEHYTYISSISAYADLNAPGIDEDAPLVTMADETVETVTGETFGPLKARCERAAEAAMPARVLTIRPGLIVGPHDPSDRFTYWPQRVARGGDVLAPIGPDASVRYIVDARDLAAWIVRMAEQRATGIFNALGPNYPLTFGALLDTCKSVSDSDARFVWTPADFLAAQSVSPWIGLPLWVPPTMTETHSVRADKAIAAGLTFRPLAETVADTLLWDATRPADTERRAGLTPDKERAVLQAWAAQSQPTDFDTTVTLYRPTGRHELSLIQASGNRAFPPRLPGQPIFYPVLNEEYAAQIARDWNAKGTNVGYVTRFDVRADFLKRYDVQTVGGSLHKEYWIPAEDLDAFNRNIVGPIAVIREFHATEITT